MSELDVRSNRARIENEDVKLRVMVRAYTKLNRWNFAFEILDSILGGQEGNP